MKQGSSNIQQYAMYFGTYMGIYWILKFILFPLSFKIPFLSFLFVGLTLGVPFMGYYYLKIFRDKACGGVISFRKAFAFTFLVYMFAAMLAAVAHFIYFQFIDHGAIYLAMETQITVFLAANQGSTEYTSLEEAFKEALDYMASLTPTDITLDNLSRNTFLGIILAIPTALIGQRNSKKEEN